MPSPFPGMDPYLEAHWRDVHASLVICARDALQAGLPAGLRARVEERALLNTLQGIGEYPRRPPTRVAEAMTKHGVERQLLPGPLLVEVDSEPVTETYLTIIDREDGNGVVTVIEFLSPASKSPGPNREQYQRKQREVCSSDANLVEIDLNRLGFHTLAVPFTHLGPAARTPYMACVRRTTRRDEAEVYPMPLWERLPAVKVPLRPGDADVPLDLQALVEQCYRNGAYEGTLDYAADPDPPLLGADKAWADERLRELGLRPRRKPRRKGKPRSR